jgi:hypothetical protein
VGFRKGDGAQLAQSELLDREPEEATAATTTTATA